MGEVVNLRRARKARARGAAEDAAAVNRAAFGRSTAERQGSKAEVARFGRVLDGAKREE